MASHGHGLAQGGWGLLNHWAIEPILMNIPLKI